MYQVEVTCQGCQQEFKAGRSDAKWCAECKRKKGIAVRIAFERSRRSPCPTCGEPMGRRAERCHLCDNKSRVGKHEGAANPNWRGGKTTTSGYTYVRNTDRADKRPYRAEHVLIWEAAKGPVPKGWHVHHVNGDKTDNRLENLQAMSASHHHSKRCDVHEDRIRELEQRIRELEARVT